MASVGLVLALSLLSLAALLLVRRFFPRRSVRNPAVYRYPRVPGGRWLVGNLNIISSKWLVLLLERWATALGPICSMEVVGRRYWILSDEPTVRRLLQQRPGAFERSSIVRDAMFSAIGAEGLFAASGDSWRRQRRLTGVAFTPLAVRRMYGEVSCAAASFRDQFLLRCAASASGAVELDFLHEMSDIAMSIFSRSTFGRSLSNPELMRNLSLLLPSVVRRTGLPFPYYKYFSLPVDRELTRAMQDIRIFVSNLMDQYWAEQGDSALTEEEGAHRAKSASLIRILFEANLAADSNHNLTLSNDEIFANVVTFVIAGYDTTAMTLAWLSYYLAANPELQLRLHDELDKALGAKLHAPANDPNGLPTHAELKELPLLQGFISETLRLKSVGSFVLLDAQEAVSIAPAVSAAAATSVNGVEDEPHVLPGESVLLLLRLPLLDASVFTDPFRFDPDRWLQPSPEMQRRIGLPFGHGPRVCIGQHFAMGELSVVCALVLSRFRLSFAPGLAPVADTVEGGPIPGDIGNVERNPHAPSEINRFTLSPETLSLLVTPRTIS